MAEPLPELLAAAAAAAVVREVDVEVARALKNDVERAAVEALLAVADFPEKLATEVVPPLLPACEATLPERPRNDIQRLPQGPLVDKTVDSVRRAHREHPPVSVSCMADGDDGLAKWLDST